MTLRLIACAGAIAFAISGPAFAQTAVTTGTVTITGSVANSCRALPTNGNSFSDTWDLGELAAADGTLRPILPSETTTAGAGIQIVCSSPPDVDIEATSLSTTTAAPAGYANTIDFTAYADFNLVNTSTETINDDSATAGGSVPSTLSSNLAASPDNVVIRADTFHTANATDVLVAGNYDGLIVVTITP